MLKRLKEKSEGGRLSGAQSLTGSRLELFRMARPCTVSTFGFGYELVGLRG